MVSSDAHVAMTLGASEGYSTGSNIALLEKRGAKEPLSTFEADLVKAKKHIYDQGVIRSFYPEQPFNGKPRIERAINAGNNLN